MGGPRSTQNTHITFKQFSHGKPSQHQFLSYTHNRIIHNAVYIGILNGTHLWEVYLFQNVCYPVKHPSCQPFALTVDWMPAKCSVRLGDAVSQKKKLVHGTLWVAGMFAPTRKGYLYVLAHDSLGSHGCRHLQPWWLSRCRTVIFFRFHTFLPRLIVFKFNMAQPPDSMYLMTAYTWQSTWQQMCCCNTLKRK